MQDFKDLIFWKKSVDLVKKIYSVTLNFPREEMYGLISQMRRCSISISSNIAEGRGRRTDKDFRSFLHNSLGSISELECQLIIANELSYISKEDFDCLLLDVTEVRKRIIAFVKILG